MNTDAVELVLRYSQAPGLDRLVLAAIAAECNPAGVAVVSQRQIMRLCGLASHSAIKNARERLDTIGELVYTPGDPRGGQNNSATAAGTYRIALKTLQSRAARDNATKMACRVTVRRRTVRRSADGSFAPCDGAETRRATAGASPTEKQAATGDGLRAAPSAAKLPRTDSGDVDLAAVDHADAKRRLSQADWAAYSAAFIREHGHDAWCRAEGMPTPAEAWGGRNGS